MTFFFDFEILSHGQSFGSPLQAIRDRAVSRQESDREDLLREATALRERVEFRIPAFDDVIVAGFRRTGGMAIYIGDDIVYQFDESGRLRRAFLDGALFRSQTSSLARLVRDRNDRQVVLRRTDLNESQLLAFRTEMLDVLTTVQTELECGCASQVQSIPTDVGVLRRVSEFLSRPLALAAEHFLAGKIAARP